MVSVAPGSAVAATAFDPAGAAGAGTAVKATRARRSDSQRNYELLLSTAAAVFAEHGTEVSMDLLAKTAGVGIGTLYRHFPNRQRLVEATYRHELEQLCAYGDDLLSQVPPDEALLLWMRRFIGYAATKKGMADALKALAAADPQQMADNRALVRAAMDKLIGAAQATASIGADVTSDDLMTGLSGLCMVSSASGWQDRAGRMVELLMAGMRAQRPAQD